MGISIIGLGKLGASMGAAMADRGFDVIGVDVNPAVVEAINAGRAPVQETDLAELIAKNQARLRATQDHASAVQGSEVSFIVVPTPSDERGNFSLQFASWACQEIGKALRNKDSYHLVVLTSTVLPGATRLKLLPLLEAASGKKAGRDFGLCYSPEFIALGSVIRDFLNPDLTLIGELDPRSGAALEALYARIMPRAPPCHRMSLENAELAKISVNSYITTKITFANMVADLCERIPGGDVDAVTRALGADARIGPKYLRGGVAYGGPCFPRDNVALAFFARAVGSSADLAETTDRANRGRTRRAVERILPMIPPGATVAVLGLAYKPDSSVVEESPGIQLARELALSGVRVVGYDPLAYENARQELKHHVVVLDSLQDCLAQADVVIVTTADPLFRKLGPGDFQSKPTRVVVDFWRCLDEAIRAAPGVHYVPIGEGADQSDGPGALANVWPSA